MEILNHALRGIPVDRIRYHICWGSWHGPHTTDFPLRDIVDLRRRVNAQAYLIEAGNVRHEHEYKIWRDVKLPAGKIVIPGVVSHATALVEHAELVADRLIAFAELVGRDIARSHPRTLSPSTLEPGADPRDELARMLTGHPQFARATVNLYWSKLMGFGIVEPADEFDLARQDLTNVPKGWEVQPSHPELLDALAKDLVDNKYSLKALVRTICKSRTYQLSAYPNEFNKHDKQNYARYYPKRMSAEVLFDAVCQVTASPTSFNGLPSDTHAPRRAIMLPDESFASYFLDVFGRPQRISACECERVSEANLAQALHLLNSQEIQDKLTRANARADLLAKDPRSDAEKIEELFLWAFARRPTDQQLQFALSKIQDNSRNRRLVYEDILWALINTKEFILVQ